MRGFASRVSHITHAQWICRNCMLHERERGHLRVQERQRVMREIDRLTDVEAGAIPEESRFLLEMDFDSLREGALEWQSHWVRAMQAATRAGRRTASRRRTATASARRAAARQRRRKPPSLKRTTDAVLAQPHEDLGLRPVSTRRRPHPSATEATRKSNKRLRKPD